MEPATPGHAKAGRGQLEVDAINAQQKQEVGHGRVGDDGQNPRAPVGLDRHRAPAAAVYGVPNAIAHLHRVAVGLRQQLIQVGGDEINHPLTARLLRGQADAIAHGPVSPLHVAPAQLGQRAQIGGRVVHDLARHGLSRRAHQFGGVFGFTCLVLRRWRLAGWRGLR